MFLFILPTRHVSTEIHVCKKDVRSLDQDLSVDTLFASIGKELRKLHFRVTRSEIIGYKSVRWCVSGETFGGKHPPSR